MVSSQTGTGGAPDDLSDIKRKLAWRMGIAGLMIVGLLVGLALFDHFSVERETESLAPQYTQPVPVPKKLTTQPLKPAEPPAEPANDTAKDQKTAATPESSAAPAEKEATPEKAAPAPEPPPPPMVTAQPVLPRASSPRGPVPASASQAAPHAAGKSAEPRTVPAVAAPAREEPVVAAEPAPIKPQPAAPRLFSGYALQAGVFSDPRRAEELHAKLTLEGIPSSIEARVQVGPFKTQAEAEAARARMKELGIDSVMLMPKGVKR